MNAHPALEKFLAWLLNHSVQAGVLVLLVLIVQWIFRGRLASRWRFALWWIVLVRLLLPVGPQSVVSLFNYVHAPVTVNALQNFSSAPPAPIRLQPATVPVSGPVIIQRPVTVIDEPARPSVPHPSSQPSQNTSPFPSHSPSGRDLLLPMVAGIWLGGVIALAGCVTIQILRFQSALRRSAVKPSEPVLELLQSCRKEFGISRRLELLETNAVQSPALFGLFRLRLLLPKGFAEKFSRQELRYIFLHELAHVKRGDLWLNWLITALQIAHWFNPLIWFGFARLRSDRELACDELALVHAGEKTGISYGETVVKLLEGLGRPAAIPGLVGILEDKKQMRRRILMIANFKRPGRWSILAALLLAAIAIATLTDGQTAKPKQLSGVSVSSSNIVMTLLEDEDAGTAPRPDLKGSVRAKGGGPLAATVFIATAGPKTGTSTFCPSCYTDCRKSAKADAQGRFKIESLNPQLLFRVLAVANGYKPKFVLKVDPAKGPISIALEPVTSADAPPDRSLRGRVVDPKGKPIEGATVEMEGVEQKDGTGMWGSIDGVDPLAVTDEKGEFLITARDPFDSMDVTVEARLFARKTFTKLPSGGAQNELKVTEGSTVTGRVLLHGKPLKDVAIGVSGVDRTAGNYVGNSEVGTATSGAFAFLNLAPNTDYYIYGIMGTMKQYGAIPFQKFRSGKDGETIDLGNLSVGPAHRLSGRVVLSDGQPVPANTRLLVSRDEAWDSVQLTLDENGSFDTTGLPEETVMMSVRVKGYHISAQNRNLDRMNFQLVGRIDRDITNLVYLLDKGPDPKPDYNMNIPDSEWPQNRPLVGAEGGVDHSREWTISGHVIDSETKQPIASFRVTPGRTSSFDETFWDMLHSAQGTNGSFLVYVGKRIPEPLLKVEADGYLPVGVNVLPQNRDDVYIELTRGSGPTGTVVLPNGTPVANAAVILLGDGRNQASLNSKGELTTMGRGDATNTRTDANGHFALNPQWQMTSVVVAAASGFARVSIDTLKTNSQITLQPFGKVTGALKRTSGLGTNEDLDLAFAAAGLSGINLNCHAVTDSHGRFTFTGVPPTHLSLSSRESMGATSWQNIPLQDVDVQAGQTVNLNVEAPDKSKLPEAFSTQPQPGPKRVSGEFIKGVVLSPEGKPAADVDVAENVEHLYLSIAKGEIHGNNLRQQGLQVSSGKDGSFSLPLFEKAISVIAMNEEGFAHISLDELKTSPQITLQKWGRIEGTFEVNHHPASNQTLEVELAPQRVHWTDGTNKITGSWIIYDNSAFQARTDDQGHFIVTFVPPGEVRINRLIPAGSGAYNNRQVGTASVKPGEPTIVHFESNGRTVVGRVDLAGTNSAAMKNARVSLNTIPTEFLIKLRSLNFKERNEFIASPEFKAAQADARYFPATLLPDGTFRIQEVTAGKYYLDIDPDFNNRIRDGQRPTNSLMYASAQQIVVPENTDKNRDVPFDSGTVPVNSFEFSLPTE